MGLEVHFLFMFTEMKKNIPSAQFGGKIRALRQRLKLALELRQGLQGFRNLSCHR